MGTHAHALSEHVMLTVTQCQCNGGHRINDGRTHNLAYLHVGLLALYNIDETLCLVQALGPVSAHTACLQTCLYTTHSHIGPRPIQQTQDVESSVVILPHQV